MTVLTRLRGCRRATGLALAVLTMVGAAGASLHRHDDGTFEGRLGLALRVPVSVIADPDAPATVFHLHSGSTVPNEPCAACVLSNTRGHIASETAPIPTAPCIDIFGAAMLESEAPAAVCADSRSPPTLA